MTTPDTELFHQIGEVLWPQSGWSLEPSPTPGGPSSWCFEHHGRVTLSVGVADGAITLYLPDLDEDLAVPSVPDLELWLEANRASWAGG